MELDIKHCLHQQEARLMSQTGHIDLLPLPRPSLAFWLLLTQSARIPMVKNIYLKTPNQKRIHISHTDIRLLHSGVGLGQM